MTPRQPWNSIPAWERVELGRRLTNRQFDVYALHTANIGEARIGELLGISRRTVRDHLRRAKQVHALIEQEAVAA